MIMSNYGQVRMIEKLQDGKKRQISIWTLEVWFEIRFGSIQGSTPGIFNKSK